uniref:Uncharacterized protein n=1 Tax=Anguilla anguilla TaxID=7936 RepID=A0A0E9TMB9_ANGAN
MKHLLPQFLCLRRQLALHGKLINPQCLLVDSCCYCMT